MSSNLQFKINQPSVVGEVIDNEAIIVNLDSGAYYSLRSVGADIWQMIEQGISVAEIADQLVHQYRGTAETTIRNGVETLVAELRQEALIIPAPEVEPPEISTPVSFVFSCETFEQPVLEKYNDMADLLLLDPIHEVDEMGGWPHPPTP
jgi:hypothetical protein